MSRAKKSKLKKPLEDKDKFVININKTDMGEDVSHRESSTSGHVNVTGLLLRVGSRPVQLRRRVSLFETLPSQISRLISLAPLFLCSHTD